MFESQPPTDSVPSLRDEDSDVDGCDIEPANEPQSDDAALPAAEGGVA